MLGIRERPGLEFRHPELLGCRALRTLGDALCAQEVLTDATQPVQQAPAGQVHASPHSRLPPRHPPTCVGHGIPTTLGAEIPNPGAPVPPATQGQPPVEAGFPKEASCSTKLPKRAETRKHLYRGKCANAVTTRAISGGRTPSPSQGTPGREVNRHKGV